MLGTLLPLPFAISVFFSLSLFLLKTPDPLSLPSKLIEVGCIALHKGDNINCKLISQMDAFHKKIFAAQEGFTSNQICITDSSVKFYNFPPEMPRHPEVS